MKLKQLKDEIGELFHKKAQHFRVGSLVIKVTTAIASTIVIIAQFASVPPGQSWPASNIVGIGAAAIIAILSFLSLVIEPDSSSELNKARQAVEVAEEAEREVEDIRRALDDLDRFEIELKRSNELYRAMTAMRGVIETALSLDTVDLVQINKTLIEAARRSLLIALGFQMDEYYTLCIYAAETDAEHKKWLRCIAQARTLECAIEDARLWPAGVGVAGAAFARQSEVVVPDLATPEASSLYGHVAKAGDDTTYKSAAAVPVRVEEADDPWGVVIGTSDRLGHFTTESDGSSGIQTVEAMRALAGMVTLAVRVCKMKSALAAIRAERDDSPRQINLD